MELYLRKSYYKTASLICDASRSCALLAGHASDSGGGGRGGVRLPLGPCFPDRRRRPDFAMDDDQLGKPAGADLSLVWRRRPSCSRRRTTLSCRPLIERRFKGDGDVTMAYETVRASTGMDLARKLAGFHAQRAVDAICRVAPDSEARRAHLDLPHRPVAVTAVETIGGFTNYFRARVPLSPRRPRQSTGSGIPGTALAASRRRAGRRRGPRGRSPRGVGATWRMRARMRGAPRTTQHRNALQGRGARSAERDGRHVAGHLDVLRRARPARRRSA